MPGEPRHLPTVLVRVLEVERLPGPLYTHLAGLRDAADRTAPEASWRLWMEGQALLDLHLDGLDDEASRHVWDVWLGRTSA